MPLRAPALGTVGRTAATLGGMLGATLAALPGASFAGAAGVGVEPAVAAGAASGPAATTDTASWPRAVPAVAPVPVPTGCLAGSALAVDPRRVPLRRTSPRVGATGHLAVSFARTPFGAAVTPDGRHVQRIEVHVEGLRRNARGTHVVWAATPSLDEARRLGTLDGTSGSVAGVVPWNQFMVIVTEEPAADVERWRGPVLLTGFSPSSRMHTMRGHGIFEPHGAGC